jgi:hypothetical protein
MYLPYILIQATNLGCGNSPFKHKYVKIHYNKLHKLHNLNYLHSSDYINYNINYQVNKNQLDKNLINLHKLKGTISSEQI